MNAINSGNRQARRTTSNANAEPSNDKMTARENIDRVRRYIAWRGLRNQIFGEDLFWDPAWDMLLQLSEASADPSGIQVDDLMRPPSGSGTSRLRHLDLLESRGLVERFKGDGALKTSVRLTEAGQAALMKLIAAMA